MLIFPALDIYQGACVRLMQGNFSAKKVYSETPIDVARSFLENGLPYLHIVDLEGAKEGRPVNGLTIRGILGIDGVHAQVGGGIRNRDDVALLLESGADRVVVGSLAVESPHIIQDWIREFGSERLVIAVDVVRGAVAHKGWLEQANLTPSAFIGTMTGHGADTFLCTAIDRDGMLAGPNVELYSSLRAEFPSLNFIASGGVSQLTDLENLAKTGCTAVVVGKALYEGRVTSQELARFSKT